MAFKRSAVRSRLSPPGRLAQLVAHPLDVREVTSSSLVSSTIKTTLKSVVFLYFSTKSGFLSMKSSNAFWDFENSTHARVLKITILVTFWPLLPFKSYERDCYKILACILFPKNS